MHAGVAIAFRFIQRVAAGEDQIGAIQQFLLAHREIRGRAGKRRQLVHTVVHDGLGTHTADERQRTRRVEPQQRRIDRARGDELVHQTAQRPFRGAGIGRRRRQVRHHHVDAVAERHLEARRRRVEDRFFDIKHAPRARKAHHQVLGTLKDEIPTQMREAEQITL
jgi:hypothetical protein